MRVINVHERELPVSAEKAAALLNSLSSDSDALWPRNLWPPMRFDRPLGVGAAGGHGPVRYTVEEFSPGQMVRFRFSGPRGFNGFHRFDLVPTGKDSVLLRHTIEMNAQGPAVLSWPLVFRPLHDALLEDALALAQAHVGAVPQVRPWSLWVKLLRRAFSSGRAPSQQAPNPTVLRTLRDKTAQRR